MTLSVCQLSPSLSLSLSIYIYIYIYILYIYIYIYRYSRQMFSAKLGHKNLAPARNILPSAVHIGHVV